VTKSHPVILDGLLNATAATWDGDRAVGFVNAWGNSFPAEEMPFGRTVRLGAAEYRLPPKPRDGPDHVEVLGQEIVLDGRRVHGIAALCFAEMGARGWSLRVEGPQGATGVDVVAPGWVIDRATRPEPGHLVCSHLHYVGGYELDHFRPVAWSVERRLPRPIPADRLRFSESPLVHLLALSLLTDDGDD
jgi:hypothetical protein